MFTAVIFFPVTFPGGADRGLLHHEKGQMSWTTLDSESTSLSCLLDLIILVQVRLSWCRPTCPIYPSFVLERPGVRSWDALSWQVTSSLFMCKLHKQIYGARGSWNDTQQVTSLLSFRNGHLIVRLLQLHLIKDTENKATPNMGDLGIWIILGVSLESGASLVKESACNAGDLGLIPELGRSPGEGNVSPLQYSCLENPMDRGA